MRALPIPVICSLLNLYEPLLYTPPSKQSDYSAYVPLRSVRVSPFDHLSMFIFLFAVLFLDLRLTISSITRLLVACMTSLFRS